MIVERAMIYSLDTPYSTYSRMVMAANIRKHCSPTWPGIISCRFVYDRHPLKVLASARKPICAFLNIGCPFLGRDTAILTQPFQVPIYQRGIVRIWLYYGPLYSGSDPVYIAPYHMRVPGRSVHNEICC